MKRKNEAIPAEMMQRWRRPPVSCLLCRTKKLRCDRAEPCSNCSLRSVECEYAEKSGKRRGGGNATNPQSAAIPRAAEGSALAAPGTEDILARIKKLEHAVFEMTAHPSPSTSPSTLASVFDKSSTHVPSQAQTPSTPSAPFTILCPLQPSLGPSVDKPLDLADLARYLPPRAHGIALFDHFEHVVRLSFGVFHVPSTRNLFDRAYRTILAGEDPDAPTLFLLFCIFAGGALASTPELLQAIGASQEEAAIVFGNYAKLAIAIVNNTATPLPASTVALVGILSLMHLITSVDGLTQTVYQLRTKAVLMAQTMGLHRLDTVKSRECRRLNGSNPIEVEVQRRIWWQLVSTDWLLSFCGGPQEGTYMFHPRQMKVNFPRNVDDDLVAVTGEHDLHASIPTSMSAFLHRVRLAELSREVVDTIPTLTLDPQEIDYDAVLALDAKFQEFLNSLPVFFKLDPASIQQSREICRERPYIPWHRISLHFGVNTRICRLHRPFHFAGSTNPKYAFSRMTCIRAAQTVLELRRSMDEIEEYGGLRPSRFWTVMQHVFLAAITLATDVSLDPTSPYASIRKAEVLAACKMLEKSQQGSAAAREAMRKGVHTLMSIIHKQCPLINPPQRVEFQAATENSLFESQPLLDLDESLEGLSKHPKLCNSEATSSTSTLVPEGQNLESSCNLLGTNGETNSEEQDWDQLWSGFFNAAGEWDTPQWESLMEGIDLNLGPTVSY